jgi:hypothetical protein
VQHRVKLHAELLLLLLLLLLLFFLTKRTTPNPKNLSNCNKDKNLKP